MEHEKYMRLALELAQEAFQAGEIPVGCVIVNENGEIIGRGQNTRERTRSALGHAELVAIDEACRYIGDWRLEGCTIYVTLEPCPMCTGAVINSRIPCVVFGAREENFGSCGSVIDLFSERYGHRPAVYSGVLENECTTLLTDFFKKIR
ncbi:MAG: tRNA-specific adenosine deaminase [Firmicutes bacterium HGW-Firmicutes-16]|nr:MAG: tRNA-specific adenosine deaminase [Firmicutes bacterium HGW-Firmicutes-16]